MSTYVKVTNFVAIDQTVAKMAIFSIFQTGAAAILDF